MELAGVGLKITHQIKTYYILYPRWNDVKNKKNNKKYIENFLIR